MSKALAPWMRDRRWYALVVGLLASIALCASTVTASASTRTRVYVQNDHSGLCMSVAGGIVRAGALINQWDCGIYLDQIWYEESSDSRPGWFYLQPVTDTNLCATYTPGSTAQLTLQSCGRDAGNGNLNTELWHFDPATSELATVQGWAMSIPGASVYHSDPINIFPWGNYPDQSWYPALV